MPHYFCSSVQPNRRYLRHRTLHHRNGFVAKLERCQHKNNPATMTWNGATKSVFQLLTCRCTSSGWRRRRPIRCRVSWIGKQSDICCFELCRAKSTLPVCSTSWSTPRGASLCFTCGTTADQMCERRMICAEWTAGSCSARDSACFRGVALVCGGQGAAGQGRGGHPIV